MINPVMREHGAAKSTIREISAYAAGRKAAIGAENVFDFSLGNPSAPAPDEVRASIASVRSLYPGRRLTVAFQPHLYSRTRDFAPEFAEALSQADDVVLCDIYPAREEPIPGVTSQIIIDRVTAPRKVLISKEDFVNTMKNRNFDILLTLGAGDLSFKVPELCRQIDPEHTVNY